MRINKINTEILVDLFDFSSISLGKGGFKVEVRIEFELK
jgi:hypothetical protein